MRAQHPYMHRPPKYGPLPERFEGYSRAFGERKTFGQGEVEELSVRTSRQVVPLLLPFVPH